MTTCKLGLPSIASLLLKKQSVCKISEQRVCVNMQEAMQLLAVLILSCDPWLYYLWRCCCYMKLGKIVLILSLLDKHLSNPIIIRNHSLALKSQPRKGKSAILGPSLLFLNTLLYLKETTKCFGCDGHLHFYDSLDSVVISQIKRYQLFSWLLQYYQSVLNKDKRKDRNVAKIFMTKSLHVGTSYWQ